MNNRKGETKQAGEDNKWEKEKEGGGRKRGGIDEGERGRRKKEIQEERAPALQSAKFQSMGS